MGKHRESKVKKMLRRLEMTKSKEGMLAKRVRQELGRVRYKLEKLNLEIAAFSHKSRKWRSLKRAGTSIPRSKKISTPVHSPQKHRALGLQVTLRAAHDKVGKIANQFNKVIAKSQRLEKAKARITRVYRLKLTRYLFQVHKLENKKRKLKMMLSVLVARSIKEATGRIWSVRKLVARNAYRVAGGRYETKMVSEIHILRLRKRKLDRQVKKEMGRYINEMMTLNRGIRVLRKIKTRMKRALKREMKNRKTELLRRSRKLNTQIELENGFINHARHASGFQKVGLAKEAKMEHRKRVQEATQLKRITDVVEREAQSHGSGMPKKLTHEENHLRHLLATVTKGTRKFAEQRIMMTRRLGNQARHAAKQSRSGIKRERVWRRRLIAAAHWESKQIHDRHNSGSDFRSSEKMYDHIIQALKTRIRRERRLRARRSKILAEKQELERAKSKIFREAKQSGTLEAQRRREIKALKLKMQAISQRLLGTHVHVEGVLCALRKESAEGETKLSRAIKHAKEVRVAAAHIMAHWASRLNKYKIERVHLYKTLIRNNVDLDRRVEMARKRFKEEQRTLAQQAQQAAQVKRSHSREHVRERFKQYSAHFNQEQRNILKSKSQNEALIRRLEKKSKTLKNLQQEKKNYAIMLEGLRKDKTGFVKDFEKNKKKTLRLKLVIERLRKIIASEIVKREKYAAQSRSGQGDFSKHVMHRRELLKALQGLDTKLGEAARITKDQRVKTTAVKSREASLEKRRAERAALLRRVQKMERRVVAELRRRRLDGARLTERRRTIRAELFKAQVARKAITEKMRRMQSLDHTPENMKGRKISYNEVLRRMRKKATDEVNQMRLDKLNLLSKLRKFEKNMQQDERAAIWKIQQHGVIKE